MCPGLNLRTCCLQGLEITWTTSSKTELDTSGTDNTCEQEDLTGSNDASRDLKKGLKVANKDLKREEFLQLLTKKQSYYLCVCTIVPSSHIILRSGGIFIVSDNSEEIML